MKLKLSNNAETTLAGALSLTGTTVLLAPNTGNKFPQLGQNEFFPLTLVKILNGDAIREIVYVVARDVDSCTVLRAQEGTGAATFAAGDYAGCFMTAGCLGTKADLDSPNFTGNTTFGGNVSVSGVSSFAGPASFTSGINLADKQITQAILKDCAPAYTDNAAQNTIDISNGNAQRWAPGTGAQTLTITGWPPAGAHGEVMIYGVNLGAATITISGNPVQFINDDRTFVSSNSLNTNHGVTLKTSGTNIIGFISPDGGVTRYAKVIA